MSNTKRDYDVWKGAAATADVLTDVAMERVRQETKWGQQTHPDGSTTEYLSTANKYRELCNEAAKDGTVTWAHILLEEVFEALAEERYEQLREELVQVAAVAVNWIEDLDRKEEARKVPAEALNDPL